MNWVTRCLTQTKVVNLVLTFNLRHSHIPIHTQTPSRRLLAQAAHVWSERVTPRSQSRTVGIPQTQALTGALLNESRYSVMARITLTAKLLQNNPFMGRHTSKNNCETPKRTFGFVRARAKNVCRSARPRTLADPPLTICVCAQAPQRAHGLIIGLRSRFSRRSFERRWIDPSCARTPHVQPRDNHIVKKVILESSQR